MLLKNVLASTHSEFPQRRETTCTGSGRQLFSDWWRGLERAKQSSILVRLEWWWHQKEALWIQI